MSCCDTRDCGERDMVRSRAALLIWCLPAAIVLLGAFWADARAALWIPSLVLMGSACVLNARRCGRLHCHITGPVFLLAALATVLDAAGILRIGWPWILLAAVAGTGVGYGLEHVRGLYVSR